MIIGCVLFESVPDNKYLEVLCLLFHKSKDILMVGHFKYHFLCQLPKVNTTHKKSLTITSEQTWKISDILKYPACSLLAILTAFKDFCIISVEKICTFPLVTRPNCNALPSPDQNRRFSGSWGRLCILILCCIMDLLARYIQSQKSYNRETNFCTWRQHT